MREKLSMILDEISQGTVEDNPLLRGKLAEEVNMLYVACTRTMDAIYLPTELHGGVANIRA